MSKRYNQSGQIIVADRFVSLSDSDSKNYIRITSNIQSSDSVQEKILKDFLDRYDFNIVGSKIINSSTTLKIRIYNENNDDVTNSFNPYEFTWYLKDGTVLAKGINEFTFTIDMLEGNLSIDLVCEWEHVIDYSIGTTSKQIKANISNRITLEVGEITEYVWNNCLTEKQLEEQGYKNSGLWKETIQENTSNYLYLWIRKSNDNRNTWVYYRSTGEQGQQGIQGDPGIDGKNAYTHIAYANSEDGSIDFSTTDFLNKKYIGIYVDFEKEDSEDYTKYKWKKYVADETRIEYCWHNSEENPPEELSASYDSLDIYYDKELVWISVFDTEHSIKAPNENDIHLWIRTSIDNGKNWEYSKFNGNPAKAIKIITNRYYFDRNETNDKGEVGEYLENQIANITLERQNISGNTDISWYFDGKLYITQSIKQSLYVTPNMLNSTGKLYISVVYDNVSYDSIELYTNVIKPTYAGILSSDNKSPTTINGRECVNGDHFIYLDENGCPIARLYINGKWKDLSSTDSQYYSLVMGDILADVINKPSVNSQNGIYQFFSNIAAYGAFIKNLYTENLKIEQGDFKTIIGLDVNNNLTFNVLYRNESIFKISPTTGKIFFGKNSYETIINGFVYDPTENIITTKNGKLIISSDGNIKIIDADISGKANINDGFFNGQIDTVSFSAKESTQNEIVNTINLSSSAESQLLTLWSWMDNNAPNNQSTFTFRCVHSTDDKVKYCYLSKTGYSRIIFYDINFKSIGEIYRDRVTFQGYKYYSPYSSPYTLTLSYGGGQIFKLKDIPDDTNVSTLESGQVYYSKSDKSLKIKI